MRRSSFARSATLRIGHFKRGGRSLKSTKPRATDCPYVDNEKETSPMQNPEKDPEDWTTGDEPMTGPQRSYLQTLCREAGEDFDENLTKAEASKKIEQLQDKTGRGK